MDYLQEVEKRAAWIKDVVASANANGVVLGLSGGKDSACVAALCVKAGVKVLGINLPIHSSPDDLSYVYLLARTFPAIRVEDLALDSMFEKVRQTTFGLIHEVQSSLERVENDDRYDSQVVAANLKARLRMVTLYTIANKFNYLVAGTGNASEAYVGYFTKWGDGANDFNPIADLTVEEVIEVGIAAGVPIGCMKRVPSAGLFTGQTDESEMGISYEDIGHVVRDRLTLVSSPTALAKIAKRHSNAKHKLTAIRTYPN